MVMAAMVKMITLIYILLQLKKRKSKHLLWVASLDLQAPFTTQQNELCLLDPLHILALTSFCFVLRFVISPVIGLYTPGDRAS